MDKLWAPWRMKYIDDLNSGHGNSCFLCEYVNNSREKENYILARKKHSYVIFNRYPYNCGHLMVVPNKHVAKLSDLTEEERSELMTLASESVEIIEKVLSPEGFNCGFNLGKAAGAGVADHIHLHIVPRWVGDCNFLPILGDTKSLPEYLDETYDRLRPSFEKIDGRK